MNPRRNRRSRAGNKTNLDDLDGALTSMIGSHNEVKLTTDPSQETRFTMHESNHRNDASRGVFASSLRKDQPIDLSGSSFTHTSDFEKHQVNYSATKYIKP